MTLTRPRLAICGFIIAVAFGTGQAKAADAKPFGDALVAAVTANGRDSATYEKAAADGDQITITGLKVTRGADISTMPPLVFTGAALRPKGGFTAQKLEVGPASVVERGQSIAWKSFTAESVTVPSAEEVKAHAHITPFAKLDVAGITESGERFPAPVQIDSVDVALTSDATGAPTGFSVGVKNLNIPPDFFAKNFLAKAYLGMLGYNSGFVVNVEVAGGYVNEGDTLTLDKLAIDISDVGKLTIAGKFSGVSLRKLSAMDVHDVQSTGKLDAFSLRFDDAGLVDRLLDMQTKTQGIKREDAISQATAGLGFFLIAIPDEAFTGKVVDAVTAFLNQPKSITIAASPKTPVAFSKLFEVIGQEPESLPSVVGASVTANQ
jgi:hypothetical protein